MASVSIEDKEAALTHLEAARRDLASALDRLGGKLKTARGGKPDPLRPMRRYISDALALVEQEHGELANLLDE